MAVCLAKKIADRDIKSPTAGKTNKCFADDDIFDVSLREMTRLSPPLFGAESTHAATNQHVKLVVDPSNGVLNLPGPRDKRVELIASLPDRLQVRSTPFA